MNESVFTFFFCCEFAAFNVAVSTVKFIFSCSTVTNIFLKSFSINKIYVLVYYGNYAIYLYKKQNISRFLNKSARNILRLLTRCFKNFITECIG